MATNPLNLRRTAFANFTITNAAATNTAAGVAIPAGAIVTDIRFCSPDAVTLTGASATVVLKGLFLVKIQFLEIQRNPQ